MSSIKPPEDGFPLRQPNNHPKPDAKDPDSDVKKTKSVWQSFRAWCSKKLDTQTKPPELTRKTPSIQLEDKEPSSEEDDWVLVDHSPNTPAPADGNEPPSEEDDWVLVGHSPNTQEESRKSTPESDIIEVHSEKTILEDLDSQCKTWQTPENTLWSYICRQLSFDLTSEEILSPSLHLPADLIMTYFIDNNFQISTDDLSIVGYYQLSLFITKKIIPTPTSPVSPSLRDSRQSNKVAILQQKLVLAIKEWIEKNQILLVEPSLSTIAKKLDKKCEELQTTEKSELIELCTNLLTKRDETEIQDDIVKIMSLLHINNKALNVIKSYGLKLGLAIAEKFIPINSLSREPTRVELKQFFESKTAQYELAQLISERIPKI